MDFVYKGTDKHGRKTIALDTSNGATIVGTYYPSDSDKGLFLLPGAGGTREHMHSLAFRLSKEYQTFTFDLNGHGESSGHFRFKEMSQSFYEVATALKREYAFSSVSALGHSMGSMVAGSVAARNDHCLEAICLMNPPTAGIDVLSQYHIDKILWRLPKSVYTLGCKLLQSNVFTHGEPIGEIPMFGGLRVHDLKEIVEDIRDAKRMDEIVEDIHIPVLYLFGGEDVILGIKKAKDIASMPESFRRMVEKTPSKDKHVEVVPDANHCFNEYLPFGGNLIDGKYRFVEDWIVDFFNKRASKEIP